MPMAIRPKSEKNPMPIPALNAALTQALKQLERMSEALATLRRELLPGQPKKFAILAEGPLEEMRRLRAEVESLATQIATAP